MAHVPNGLFSDDDDTILAKKIIRKLGMKGHDKQNPATRGQIRAYLVSSPTPKRLKRILRTLIQNSPPVGGTIKRDKIWVTEAYFNNPIVEF